MSCTLTDDAPEFLGELMTAVAAVTGTHRTSTCGHNPQFNGEIEAWWRFWNRAMRYLPPSQYLVILAPIRPTHLLRLQLRLSHESIAQLSPFEMDFAWPPNSPSGPPDPAFVLFDQT
jgi:hypothetical protein